MKDFYKKNKVGIWIAISVGTIAIISTVSLIIIFFLRRKRKTSSTTSSSSSSSQSSSEQMGVVMNGSHYFQTDSLVPLFHFTSTNSYRIEMIVNPTSAGFLIGFENEGVATHWFMQILPDTTLQLHREDDGGGPTDCNSQDSVALNEIHTIVYSYDGSLNLMKGYVDDVEYCSCEGSGDQGLNAMNMMICANKVEGVVTNLLAGTLYSVKIWKSAEELEADLVGDYSFNGIPSNDLIICNLVQTAEDCLEYLTA